MSLSSDGAVMTMPVTPAYQGGKRRFRRLGRRLGLLDHPVPDLRHVRLGRL